MQNITFENFQNYPALKMTWRNEIKDADVIYSFGEINNALAKTDQPIFMIVDLTGNPTYPLLTTVHEALPAYRNDMVREWLVIGNNWMARTIEGTLAKMTGKKNVRWFKTEADVLTYITHLTQFVSNSYSDSGINPTVYKFKVRKVSYINKVSNQA